MIRIRLLWSACIPIALAACGGGPPPNTGPGPSGASDDAVPLSLVIAQVEAAINQYQKNLGNGPEALPPLSSAEFEFKTTTATTVGGKIDFWIVKFGASRENDVVNDVTFSYAAPPPPITTSMVGEKPPTLTEALAHTIQAAAASVKTSTTAAGLNFSKLAVTVQYGVKWDGTGSGSGPISFVTAGLNFDRNKNTVQSVKLVFGK